MAENTPYCGVCDTSVAASWKCEACNLFLCDCCNTIRHNKMEHHVPITLQKTDTCVNSEVNLAEMKCFIHSEHSCNLYCRNCEHALCSSCVIKPHQGEELNKILSDKTKILSELKTKFEDALPFYLEKVEEFDTMDSEGFDKYNEIKEKIYTRKTYLKERVENEAKKGLDVLNSLWPTQDNPITQEKDRLQTVATDLTTRKRKLEGLLEAQVPEEIFKAVEQLDKDVPEKSALNIKVPKFMFIQTEPTEHEFNSFFGLLMKKPSLKIIVRYDIDLPDIAGIVTLNDKMSVVYSAKTRTFKHLTITDAKIIPSVKIKMDTEIQKLKNRHQSEKPTDMTAYQENILFTLADYIDQVMLYNVTSVNKFTDFDSLQATCVHCNGSEIFVGYQYMKVPYPHSSGIMVLNCKKQVKRKFEFSEQKILSFPAKVVTNINNDIFVIDHYCRSNPYENRKRVVVLSKWGQPKWNYEGNQTFGSKVGFSPLDIVTTGLNLVLVAEKETSSIHVLSENGQFITQLGRDQGIFRPVSLNINKHGQLLIGCSSYDSENAALQLCLTELSIT